MSRRIATRTTPTHTLQLYDNGGSFTIEARNTRTDHRFMIGAWEYQGAADRISARAMLLGTLDSLAQQLYTGLIDEHDLAGFTLVDDHGEEEPEPNPTPAKGAHGMLPATHRALEAAGAAKALKDAARKDLAAARNDPASTAARAYDEARDAWEQAAEEAAAAMDAAGILSAHVGDWIISRVLGGITADPARTYKE